MPKDFLPGSSFLSYYPPAPMDWDKFKSGDRNASLDASEELTSFGMALAKRKCPWLSEEDLEDAAVAAFQEIHRQIKSISTESDFRARFTERVRYRALDEVEKNTRLKSLAQKMEESPGDIGDSYQDFGGAETLPYTSIIQTEDRALIITLLNTLPPEDRSLLHDRYGLGMKQREISQKHGWGVSSVTARIEGALKRAKETLSSDPRLKNLPGINHDEI